jgi:hypothetical protein
VIFSSNGAKPTTAIICVTALAAIKQRVSTVARDPQGNA